MRNNMKHSKRKNFKKDIKVVYISSPMKVKTCATRFRALVQELTGKDSDVAVRFMDNDDNSSDNSLTYFDSTKVVDDHVLGSPSTNFNHGSMFESFDDGLVSDGSFLGMFTSNLFHDPSYQLDTYGGFGSI